jgi:hypothetical protein
VVNLLEAARGAEEDTFHTNLLSDVITIVDGNASYYNDLGKVQFSLGMKDPGVAGSPTSPTQANWITVNRYHVRFVRADGRNVQGVDVPYEFDGAFTVTVSGNAEAGFTLVRNVAKIEAPLAALGRSFVIISTIAHVTFYGHDQTGREVSATAQISVDFGNFADPK